MRIRRRNHLPAVFDSLGYHVGCEVGVFLGAFSAHLLRHSQILKLHSIDPWSGNEAAYLAAAKTLAPFGDRCTIWRVASPAVASQFTDVELDFCYIDGDHSYAAVCLDLAAWWPKIRTGGMLCGHDYKLRRSCGVKPAVDKFVQANGLTLGVTDGEPCKSWWMIKG